MSQLDDLQGIIFNNCKNLWVLSTFYKFLHENFILLRNVKKTHQDVVTG